MSTPVLSQEALAQALALRDLTDPAQGRHAMQTILADLAAALSGAWGCAVEEVRANPVVSVADNYDRLHYPEGGAARDARYTRYVGPGTLLRTQTSALVPPALRRLARRGPPPAADVLLVCPGLVYRRDVIDRLHTGEPHQVDLWRIRRGPPLGPDDLEEMIRLVAAAVAPGRALRITPAAHPYTVGGRQIDVAVGDRAGEEAWVEIGECGLALPALLAESGLPGDASGLAMGLGLDRLVMLRKGIDDIRLLRSADPRVAAQLADLTPYRPVSRHPPIRRDLSIAVPAGEAAEELGDRVREALGERAREVEAVEVLGETAGEALPAAARARLGLRPGQKNVLLRVVLRAPERTLTDAEANGLRDAVFAALHRGAVHLWAAGGPPPVGRTR
jgi:phenylalanyl-tRNA synthetase alpha chain